MFVRLLIWFLRNEEADMPFLFNVIRNYWKRQETIAVSLLQEEIVLILPKIDVSIENCCIFLLMFVRRLALATSRL